MPLNPLRIITNDAELTNSPKKEIKEIKLITFLDFLANKYLFAIRVDTFILVNLINRVLKIITIDRFYLEVL